MKTTFALCTLIFPFASPLLVAADNSLDPASIDFSLTRIEVAATLKQYEKVRSLLMEAELDRKLQNADSNLPEEKKATLDSRIEILSGELTRLRTFAADALKAARERFQRESETTQRIRLAANLIDPDPENGDVLISVPELDEADPDGRIAHITALNGMVKYRLAKARYLKAKSHFQKLELLCE